MARTRITQKIGPKGKVPRKESLRRVLGENANRNLRLPSSSGGTSSTSSASNGSGSSSSSSINAGITSWSSSLINEALERERSRDDMDVDNDSDDYENDMDEDDFHYGLPKKVYIGKTQTEKPSDIPAMDEVTPVECEVRSAPLTVCILLIY